MKISTWAEKAGVTLQSHRAGYRSPGPYWPSGTRTFFVTLSRDGREFTTEFHMGPALNRDPDIVEVLQCLSEDFSTYENSEGFSEWCRNLGLEEDSPLHHKMYREVRQQYERFREWLNDQDLFNDLLCWDTIADCLNRGMPLRV